MTCRFCGIIERQAGVLSNWRVSPITFFWLHEVSVARTRTIVEASTGRHFIFIHQGATLYEHRRALQHSESLLNLGKLIAKRPPQPGAPHISRKKCKEKCTWVNCGKQTRDRPIYCVNCLSSCLISSVQSPTILSCHICGILKGILRQGPPLM